MGGVAGSSSATPGTLLQQLLKQGAGLADEDMTMSDMEGLEDLDGAAVAHAESRAAMKAMPKSMKTVPVAKGISIRTYKGGAW